MIVPVNTPLPALKWAKAESTYVSVLVLQTDHFMHDLRLAGLGLKQQTMLNKFR